jgi:2,4-dienoyl-CoA reductase-like NADH-dependent reductase (Old Yellow Enzyme family)
VVDEVIAAIGASRVGLRFSPFGFFQGAGTSDIHEHYGYIVSNLESRGISYVHFVEPRSDLSLDESAKYEQLLAVAKSRGVPDDEAADYVTLKPFRAMLKTTPLITAGGYSDTNASIPIEAGQAEAVVIGRFFISNPDIVERLSNGWALSPYDRSTFYTPGSKGYTDYPVYGGSKKSALKI